MGERWKTAPRALRVAIVAAVVGGVGWLTKLAIMAAEGGPDPDSVAETIAFLTGLVGVVVAAAAAGAHLSRGRRVAVRAVAALGSIAAVGAFIGLGQALLPALPGDGWLEDEAVFGLVGLAALASGVAALLRSRRLTSHA